jgi:5'-nucleotidase
VSRTASDILILLTNDDGIHATGLLTLEKALSARWGTVVVAPDREQSAASHALTLHHPLRMVPMGAGRFAVDGTPTDCVMLSMHGLLPRRPDVVVSGINQGSNLGDDVIYSGTVAAAVEGTLLGARSAAISLAPDADGGFDFRQAAEVSVTVVERMLAEDNMGGYLLNVNIPSGVPGSARGIRVCRLGRRVFREGIFHNTDPRGRPYYWIGGQDPTWEGGADSDFQAIEDGFISVAPLRLDWTHEEGLERVRSWGLERLGPPRAGGDAAGG